MHIQTKVDLHGLVVAELAVATSPDPGIVAAAVLAQVPDYQLRDALAFLLRSYVRQVSSLQRGSHLSGETAARSPGSNRSAKVEGIREMWRRSLTDRVHVGRSVHRFLKDCTCEDLMAAAQERAQLAVANQVMADRFAEFAALIAKHKVTTFGDLPEPVLAAALS